MRMLAFIEYCALAVGVLAAIAGRVFSLEQAVSLGVCLAGAGLLLGGFESIYTRRMSFRFYDNALEGYGGAAALIAGLMQTLIGGLAIAAAYSLAAHTWLATLDALALRPWPALVPVGLLSIGGGVLLVLGFNDRNGIAWTLLIGAPKTALGLALVIGGAAAAIAGTWQWFDPKLFARLIALVPIAELRTAELWWRSAIALLRA